jgi:TolA-binding protein
MFGRCMAAVFLMAPLAAAADKPNPDILALQRDVAILQELVKTMQGSLGERMTALQGQVQVSVDAAKEATAAVGAVKRSVDQALKEQETKLVAPVAGIGARVDGVSGELRTVQQALTDLVGVINKLQSQVLDLNNAVKVLQPPAGAATPAPPASANDLFTNAEGDRMQGKLDLAVQEYTEFLKWYGDYPQASQAKYQIAQIYYAQKEYESAVKEFDELIQKYPDSQKMPEILYYKGMSLKELGRANQAADAFSELRKRFPNHTLAKQSLNPKRG